MNYFPTKYENILANIQKNQCDYKPMTKQVNPLFPWQLPLSCFSF